ncbi:MAG: radical SAM protein [Pseudomonadota bacterium]
MPVRYGKKVPADDLFKELAKRSGYPVSCMINLTRRCNLRCRHCYQVKRGGKELTARQWSAALRDLADTGVLLLTFSGGEPLVRKDFFSIARAARKLHFSIRLKTNAWLLDEKKADFLADTGFEQVQISLYSLKPEAHDGITGRKGSLDRVLRAARMLRERGVSVHLSMPMMDVNAAEIPRMAAFAGQEGFEYGVDPNLTVCEDGSCSPVSLRQSSESMVSIYGNAGFVDKRALRRAVRSRIKKPDEPVCGVGTSGIVIEPPGDVLPCVMLNLPLGNIGRARLKDIWDGNPLLKLVRGITWSDLHTCCDCDLRPWCTRCHGCALLEDGDLFGPSRLACEGAEARKTALEGKE